MTAPSSTADIPASRWVGGGKLPAEFGCIGCGYVLGSTRVRVGGSCVECGRVVEEMDVVSWEAREAILARRAARARLMVVLFIGLVVLVAGVGALAGGGGSAVLAVGVVGGAVGLSLVMGWIDTRGSLAQLRSAWMWVWIENLWRVHFVWLAPAVVGVPVLVGVGALRDDAWRAGAAVVVVVLWLVGSIAMLAVWDQRLSRVPLATPREFIVSTMVMLFPNLFAGGLMGMMSAAAAEEVVAWWWAWWG